MSKTPSRDSNGQPGLKVFGLPESKGIRHVEWGMKDDLGQLLGS